MLESIITLGRARPQADALANTETAGRFWDALPRGDPLQMQRLICEELAKCASWTTAETERFRALRILDRRASRLLEGIVSEYAALNGQSPALERQLWQAALELCRAFAQDFERILRALQGGGLGTAWQERTPELLVRLFYHRELDLLLSLCQYEKWPRGRMRSMHDAYRYAIDKGYATRAVPVEKRPDGSVTTTTAEQAYLRVLLLHLVDGGQLRPEEIVRARRAIAGWSRALGLQKAPIQSCAPDGGFTVDLAGTDGLMRAGAGTTGDRHWLDTSPITESIDATLAEMGDPGPESTSYGVRQRVLLLALQRLYAPQRIIVRRRGERTPLALVTVEAALGGLQTIFRMLRDAPTLASASASTPYADEITITDVGSAPASRTAEGSRVAPSRETYGNLRSTWHMRDRSDSGCRLRGRFEDARRVVPGLLIAHREDRMGPWTVGVVRRLNRLIGNNVEIGVEIIGRNPQRIVLLSCAAGSDGSDMSDAQPDRFIGLFLPEGSGPAKSIKTLLMPSSEYAHGRVMTMLSTSKETAIRLREPLEQQADFVRAAYEAINEGPPAPSGG
jgi:hypothetical protein